MQVESSAMGSMSLNTSDESEWDVYGDDNMYTIPGLETFQPRIEPVWPSNPTAIDLPLEKAEEDGRIKALVETPSLKWPREMHDAYGCGRGFGRRRGGRLATDHSYCRGGLGSKTPPTGYICYRCNEPGHFIQHCPTNGDSNYDIKRMKLPTGVPRSMLITNPEGSYVLPSGDVAILKPDEAAFEKEMEGLPTTHPVHDLPPELHCPLCKQVMRDAVLTSKCCFSSFCDKCIRDYIISKSMCFCGASKILTDDLLPNLTLREVINQLESSSSSSDTYGSLGKIQASAHRLCPKAPSITLLATSKDEEKQTPIQDSPGMKEGGTSKHKVVYSVKSSLENVTASAGRVELSDRTPKSDQHVHIKAPSPSLLSTSKDENCDGMPIDMSSEVFNHLGNGNCDGMPFSLSAYNPYWIAGAMSWGYDGCMMPLSGAMPYMGYTPNFYGIPLEGIHSQYSLGLQGYKLSDAPQSNCLIIALCDCCNCWEYSKEREIHRERSSHVVDHHHIDRKRKAITSSSRDEGGNKRKLSEMANKSKENHSCHRHRASITSVKVATGIRGIQYREQQDHHNVECR